MRYNPCTTVITAHCIGLLQGAAGVVRNTWHIPGMVEGFLAVLGPPNHTGVWLYGSVAAQQDPDQPCEGPHLYHCDPQKRLKKQPTGKFARACLVL